MKKVFMMLTLVNLSAFAGTNTFVIKSAKDLTTACVDSKKCTEFEIELQSASSSNFDAQYGIPNRIQIAFEDGPRASENDYAEWEAGYLLLSDKNFVLGELDGTLVKGRMGQDFKKIKQKLADSKCSATVVISDGQFDENNFKSDDGVKIGSVVYPYLEGQPVRTNISCKK